MAFLKIYINVRRKHNVILKINPLMHVKCPKDLFIMRIWVIFTAIFIALTSFRNKYISLELKLLYSE